MTPFDAETAIKGDTQDAERVTPETLKGDIAMSPEPPLIIKESSKEPSGEMSDLPSDLSPDWFDVLSGLPKFKTSLADAEAWLSKKGITADQAEDTAYEVKAFIAQPKHKGRDPWATFQNWARKDSRSSPPPSDGGDPIEKHRLAAAEIAARRANR
jgi:hypothetical protein